MRYNTQVDPRWSSSIMTQGNIEGKSWVDKIGRWGCLVTSLANIFQEHSQKEFTPFQFNEILTGHKGYYFLSGKSKDINTASFLDWDVAKSLLLFDVENNAQYSNDGYFIARIQTAYGGHYINVIKKLSDYYLCFDVLDGYLKYLRYSEITMLIKIKFIGG